MHSPMIEDRAEKEGAQKIKADAPYDLGGVQGFGGVEELPKL